MSFEAAMNPIGGAESRRVMERCPLALVSVQLVVSTVEHESFPAKAPKDDFCEPPIADPHDGWCGEGRLNTVPYPISPWLRCEHLLQYRKNASQCG